MKNKYPVIEKDILVNELKLKFSTLAEAKAWLIDFANEHNQTLQDGEYEGIYCSINYMIKHISSALGEDVDSAFESSYYWALRNAYEDNILMPD